MGGAYGALGGDLSVLGVNPGGLGVFRKSEFSLTSVLDFSTVKSDNASLSHHRQFSRNTIILHLADYQWSPLLSPRSNFSVLKCIL